MDNVKRSAVILAGGKGTRLEPLTTTRPKPLIYVAGLPIIKHNMQSLWSFVDEFIIVVGYQKELIESELGGEFNGKPIKYAFQQQQLGTADALKCAENQIVNNNFFLINGDDIYASDIFETMANKNLAIAGKTLEKWEAFGVLQVNAQHKLTGIIEKPNSFMGNIVNIGVYLIDKSVFAYEKEVLLSQRGEYELTDLISQYCKYKEIDVVLTHDYWLTIGYPWHILMANEVLLPKIVSAKKGHIESNVVIKGNARIGDGTIIKSGTYIDGNVIIGDDCVIGPHSYIRGNVAIGNQCKIGSSVEIEHSSIGDRVNIEHLSFIGYSVLGNNIIIGGGTITADRRHDREPIRVNIKEQLIDTNLHHLGAIIGDYVRTGINTSIYPGRKMHYHSYTAPGEIVKQDKLSSQEINIK